MKLKINDGFKKVVNKNCIIGQLQKKDALLDIYMRHAGLTP